MTTTRQVYVYDEDVVNAQVFRDEANDRLLKTDRFNESPMRTLIHFHKQSEDCKDQRHEYYRLGPDKQVQRINFEGALAKTFVDGTRLSDA